MPFQALLKQKPGQQLAFVPNAQPAALAETLIALANSEGGTVVLGLSAEGRLGDIFVTEDAADTLRAALRLCKPPVKTDWQHEQVAGGVVVLLRVEKSSVIHTLADGRVLVRKGAENRASEGADFDRLLANRPTGDFETQSVAGATREDLDEDIIENYLERRQKRNPRSSPLPKDKLLQQVSALTADKTPTVSGLLLFGREPQLFMPHSRVIFVKFADTSPRGEGGSFGYGRREELIGPLPVIIDRAWRVIWEEMDKRAVVRGLIREEQLEYPEFAVREALVNAVAHRDYRLTGRSIEIRMYTDRLEITSPGGLPAHITLDNMVEEHYSRNPRVVNGLYQWGYIEELGLGVDRMIEDMVNAGHAKPKFEAKEHGVSVILYNKRESLPASLPAAALVNPPTSASNESSPSAPRPPSWESNMNERQAKALEFLQHHGAITNSDYRALCPHVGPETLRLDLADLVERALLLKIGDKRGTRYIMK